MSDDLLSVHQRSNPTARSSSIDDYRWRLMLGYLASRPLQPITMPTTAMELDARGRLVKYSLYDKTLLLEMIGNHFKVFAKPVTGRFLDLALDNWRPEFDMRKLLALLAIRALLILEPMNEWLEKEERSLVAVEAYCAVRKELNRLGRMEYPQAFYG